MNEYKQGIKYAIDELEEFIMENQDGKKIEQMAEQFQVPVSVAAVRMLEVIVLEKLREMINKN